MGSVRMRRDTGTNQQIDLHCATTSGELKQFSRSHYGFVTTLIDSCLSDGPASQALREIR